MKTCRFRTDRRVHAPGGPREAMQPMSAAVIAPERTMPTAGNRAAPDRDRHRHLGLGQVGCDGRARRRHLLLHRQPAARVAAAVSGVGAGASAPAAGHRGRRAHDRIAAGAAAADEAAACRRHDRAADLSGREHRCAGAALLRDTAAASAVAGCPPRTPRGRRAPGADRCDRPRARTARRPACGLERDRHQPAAAGAAATTGCANWCRCRART